MHYIPGVGIKLWFRNENSMKKLHDLNVCMCFDITEKLHLEDGTQRMAAVSKLRKQYRQSIECPNSPFGRSPHSPQRMPSLLYSPSEFVVNLLDQLSMSKLNIIKVPSIFCYGDKFIILNDLVEYISSSTYF